VDDASPDGTQEIAKQLAKVYGEDKIVRSSYSCSILMPHGWPVASKTACWEAGTWVRLLVFTHP
jgi:hypothetical protein